MVPTPLTVKVIHYHLSNCKQKVRTECIGINEYNHKALKK